MSKQTDEWRRLALQFDGQRMQAMALLRLCIAELSSDDKYAKLLQTLVQFNAAPPLDGERVLAERLAALAPKEPQA